MELFRKIKARSLSYDLWKKYNYADFPSVRWKLHNLERLKAKNPKKHPQLYSLLKELLEKLPTQLNSQYWTTEL